MAMNSMKLQTNMPRLAPPYPPPPLPDPKPRGTWCATVSWFCHPTRSGVTTLRPTTPTLVSTPSPGGRYDSGAWPGTNGYLGCSLG